MQVQILPPLPWIFREADAAERALDLVAKTYCDRLGIRWRRASRTTISIARRADVARLDPLFEYREPS